MKYDYQSRDNCMKVKRFQSNVYFAKHFLLHSFIKTQNWGVLYIDILKQDGFDSLLAVQTNISMMNIDKICSLNTNLN